MELELSRFTDYKKKVLDNCSQIDIFRIFWKLLLGFCAMALLMGCGDQLATITIPVGLITLTCCVILMRSLRHDASVYCTPRFQAMNLLTVAVVMLLAAALSSDAFLGAVALFFVFRWLSRRNRQSEGKAITGQRTTVERTSAGRRFSVISTPVEQVRSQYRKYLKLCRANGFDFEKSETSWEIEFKTKKAMEAENVHAMRELYIKARYHEEATKEDAAEAKRLYQRLSASAKDKT